MKKILSFVFLMFLFFCSKSDSSDAISSEENNSNLPETFGNWSPDFTNQTTNFNQTRTGSKGTNETREITVTSSDEVLLSIEIDSIVLCFLPDLELFENFPSKSVKQAIFLFPSWFCLIDHLHEFKLFVDSPMICRRSLLNLTLT